MQQTVCLVLTAVRSRFRRIFAVYVVKLTLHEVPSVCTVSAVAVKQYRSVLHQTKQVDRERAEKLAIDKDHNKAALLAGFRIALHVMRVRISYNSKS